MLPVKQALIALVIGVWLGGWLLGAFGAVMAGEVPESPYNKALALVDAIYQAEGGPKAKVPYGLIYSGWCKAEPGWCKYYASEIVSIKYAQWERRGKPGEFIDYLGDSYCPESAHPLNKHWKKNVKKFYQRATGSAQFEMESTPVSAVRG